MTYTDISRMAGGAPGGGLRRAVLGWLAMTTATAVLSASIASTAHAVTVKRCCYRVQVVATGSMSSDYGAPARDRNSGGTHSYRWRWVGRALMAYFEHGRDAELSTCPSFIALCSPVLVKAHVHEESDLYRLGGALGACRRDWDNTPGGAFRRQSGELVDLFVDDTRWLRVFAGIDYDDKCWRGVGNHAVGSQEWRWKWGSRETADFDAFAWTVSAPAISRFRSRAVTRGRMRFQASFGWDFAMPQPHYDIRPDHPHSTKGGATVTITFTGFPQAEWKQERRKLTRAAG